jgi:5-bromo-4-chloroindolyl phosphate hydrolysis protein
MKKQLRDILSAFAAAALFLVLYFAVKWNFFISAALAVGVFFSVAFLFKPREKIGSLYVDELKGGAELRALLDDACAHLDAISACAGSIRDPDVYDSAGKLYATGEKILKYLEANPDKISVARRFINYHLETADNLLQKYAELKSANIQTEDMQRLCGLTAHALVTLHSAFEEQFEKLTRNDIMDVEAEIKVIETMFKTEGLV